MSSPLLIDAVTLCAGFALGLMYFAVLRRSVDLFLQGRSPLRVAALTLGRITAATLFLVIAARLGPLSLLAGLAGFLLARTAALRAERGAL